MTQGTTNFKQLFPLAELARDRIDEIAKDQTLAPLQEKLKSKMKGLKWEQFVPRLLKEAEKLLDIQLIDTLTPAWSKFEELQQYADPQQHPPGQDEQVHLLEHRIESKHAPSMEIVLKSLGNLSMGTLTLDVCLTIILKGAVLTIRDGLIKQAAIGNCEAGCSVSLAGCNLVEHQRQIADLPDGFSLGEGVPLSLEAARK